MSDDIEIFVKLLRALDTAGLLPGLIVVGGWSQIVYRKYFQNPPELSPLRTADLDILIPRPPRFSRPQQVGKVLMELGYEEELAGDGSTHYVSKDLNVEFLIPEIGRGSDKPFRVEALGINAQQLRLLDMLQAHTIIVPFEGLAIRVPDPVVFAFHKLLVSRRRIIKEKAEKDLLTGRELLSFLIDRPEWRKSIAKHYHALPRNRKADLVKIAQKHVPEVLPLLGRDIDELQYE